MKWYIGGDGLGSYCVFQSDKAPQAIIGGFICNGATYQKVSEGYETEMQAKDSLYSTLTDGYDENDDEDSLSFSESDMRALVFEMVYGNNDDA